MIAFGALMLRDLAVLRKNFIEFVLRTVMQPLLFVFVFTYVFPQIGQGVGGAGQAEFSSILVPGVIAIACIFQGIQAVALPLVQEFGFTREIEDRVMAPLPVWAVASGKLLAGAVQGLIAAAIVFPLAHWIPVTPVHLQVNGSDCSRCCRSPRCSEPRSASPSGRAPTPAGPPDLRPGRHPDHVPGRDVLPMGRADADPVAEGLVLLNPLVYMSEGCGSR